jgi:hypothetical protein
MLFNRRDFSLKGRSFILRRKGQGWRWSLAGALTAGLLFVALAAGPLQAASAGADVVVLVNSQSARYLDFQQFIQPYLDNFGFPYTVQDISTNAPAPSLSNCAGIIIGHSQLDTNRTYLNDTVQANISVAVSNGTGLVNFDNDLAVGSTPRYQFVQSIFGFTYGSGASASSVSLPPTEPSSQMHYITARHPANDSVTFRSSITLPGITVPGGATTLALAGGEPLVAITKYGQGRAVQWGSYAWMVSTVLGPVDGLDDLLWRGVVWAARKPFVMRGLPNLVTMRVDDVSGPFWWVHLANQVGFKPFLALFLNDVSETNTADLQGLVTNGNATTSIHSFDCCSTFFYFNYSAGMPLSDTVQSNNFYVGTQWHLNHGIPISKVCATHYSEIGPNAFSGLKNWGMEFVPIEVVPGTVEYSSAPPYPSPGAPWLVGGPYRLYETPQEGQVNWPTYYADWLAVPGHPELNGQFFNVYSEVRDVASCGEWCPDTDVAGSIDRGTQILQRDLDSMVMATAFTHEWSFQATPCCPGVTTVTTNQWMAILQGITNNLAAYNPIFVTLDYASQYVRAIRTSRLLTGNYDPVSGHVTVTLSGQTDLDTSVYVFTGADSSISNSFGTVPIFSGSVTDTVATLPSQPVPPTIINAPASVTTNAGTTVVFTVTAGGTAPLSYQWLSNSTNLNGAISQTLSLTNVQPSQAGNYSVVLSNAQGMATSAVAVLTVLVPPGITLQPTNQTTLAGTTVSFSTTASGTTPMSYQWQSNGTNLDGAVSQTLSLTNVQPAQAGDYRAVASNAGGSATSMVAVLTVLVPPGITLQPTNQTVLAGTTVHFSTAASGTTPLSYQWQFKGTNLDGAVSQTLGLTNVQPAQAGDYRAVASNAGGSATSAVAVLTVLVPPGITLQPTNQTVLAGATVNFSAAASGTTPLSYQWQFNNTNLDGAVSQALSLTNVQPAQAGGYSVLVTNSAGSVTSVVAILTVAGRPLLLNAKTTPGGAFAFTISSTTGLVYMVEITTNFLAWTPLTSVTNTTGQADFTDTASSNSVSRFYRARWMP